MKSNKPRFKPASIAKTRWVAYAAAGAATALAGSNSAEAAIHYSGRLDVPFADNGITIDTFQLDQPGDSFRLTRVPHYSRGNDFFNIFGIASAEFRGRQEGTNRYYVSRLSFGQRISRGPFTTAPAYAGAGFLVLGSSSGYAQWTHGGYGYIGFVFNNGAGVQYGWARIRMTGFLRVNAFKLVDYAYADPGEPITAGQTSGDEQAPDQGSLGWLALGAAGLLAWRKSRSLTARLEDA